MTPAIPSAAFCQAISMRASSRLTFSGVLLRPSSADPFHEIAAGVGKFDLHALDQVGNRRHVRDLADTLSRTPEVSPHPLTFMLPQEPKYIFDLSPTGGFPGSSPPAAIDGPR